MGTEIKAGQMARPVIDIVVTTMNRLDHLQRTLTYIYERTRSEYRLHVLDDASTEGNADWLIGEWKAGRVHHLLLHGQRVGAMAQLNQGGWMSFSPVTVFTDDDVLCPDVEPDWLARGWRAMQLRRNIGLLALNHPRANRKKRGVDADYPEITYCGAVGGTFMFVRRGFLKVCPLPHAWGNFGITPTTTRCGRARAAGFRIAYLTDTYCQHIGKVSVLTGKEYCGQRRDVFEVDPVTLEPINPKFRG